MTNEAFPGDARSQDRRLVLHALQTAEEYDVPEVVSAQGCWLTLADGTRLLDMHGQYMSAGMGHGDPDLRAALHAAIDSVDFVCESFSHAAKGRAARLLLEETTEGSDWAGAVRFVCTGSEAVELALLMARLYTDRPTIITEQGAYHGWTPGANAATSMPYLRNVYMNPSTGEVRVPRGVTPDPVAPAPICAFCGPGNTCSRCVLPDGRLAYVVETERMIRSIGVGRVAAYITELYHGAAGFMVPDPYPQQVREMTERLGIVWIDDEAIAGAGRTGKWWAYQHYGVEPDLLVTAKGLSSSAAPAGAVMASKPIAEFFRAGRWNAVSTFAGHPLSVAAVAANIETMVRDHVVEHAAAVGSYLEQRLHDLAAAHPSVGGVSGRGLAWSVELVKNAETGERWIPGDRWHNPGFDRDPDVWPGQFVASECMAHGVWVLNFVPNAVTLAPPLRISRDEIDLGVRALDAALTALDHLAAGTSVNGAAAEARAGSQEL